MLPKIEKIAEVIYNNKNIIEKKEINPIVEYIDKNSYKSNRIFSDIGEDSAAIKNEKMFMLITTDRIRTDFIESFPFGAGFSSILVGIDDIYACGGTPLAASLIISFANKDVGQKIIEGVCKGSRAFQIPIVRGHTNIHSKCYELSTTIIGEIKKENYISAGNAKVGDCVILAVDLDGKVGDASKYYWDTATFKNSEEILRKRKSMNIIAEKHLAHSSKDISNGGIFGTLLQLTNYSRVGANVNISSIEIPLKLLNINYSLEMYIQMYLTTSFVLTASIENCEQIISIFKKHGMMANIIGKIIKEPIMKINDGKETIDVI